MRNNLERLVLLSTLVASSAVFAESASDRVTQLEAETLVLKAREKQLEVQSNIISKQNEILLKQAATERMTQSTVVGDPVIRSIESIGKKTFVTLQLSNGHIIDAQVGDVLPNGMKILSIKPNEVVVEKDKRRTYLAGASETPPAFNPNFPTAGLNLGAPVRLPIAAPRGAAR